MLRSQTRLSRRSTSDVRAIRRATKRIEELSAILDRQLVGEPRPEEQLRHLRQATGQITRTANDAIQAYRRVSQALRIESEQADADETEIARATEELSSARAAMLHALEVASRRYPWAEPWKPAGT
ncbi:MAG: hypothetical protein ACRDGD_06025 [Candidatus Limnocylindria bacterium]